MFKIAVGHSEDVDTLVAAQVVIEQCKIQLENLESQAKSDASATASLCLMFPDTYHFSLQEIINALNLELGRHCPVFGGGAGTLETEIAPL